LVVLYKADHDARSPEHKVPLRCILRRLDNTCNLPRGLRMS